MYAYVRTDLYYRKKITARCSIHLVKIWKQKMKHPTMILACLKSVVISKLAYRIAINSYVSQNGCPVLFLEQLFNLLSQLWANTTFEYLST